MILYQKKKVGILGHSKGAYAATIVNYDKTLNIDFLILIGSPTEWKGEWRKHKFKETRETISEEIIYKNIIIPTLFIGGKNDTTSNMLSSFDLLTKLNNKAIDIKILDDLDHFLRIGNDEWKQTKDYSTLYEINRNASELIVNWIIDTEYNENDH